MFVKQASAPETFLREPKLSASAALGMAPGLCWRVATVLYFAGLCVYTALILSGGLAVDDMTIALTVSAVGAAAIPVWIWCALTDVDEIWVATAIILGFALIAIVIANAPADAASAMGLWLLFALIVPAYLLVARQTLPHIVIGLIALVGTAYSSHSPQWETMAVVFVFVGATGAGVLLATQERLRRLIAIDRRLSHTDPLTGLANRREMDECLTESVENGTLENLVLYCIDLDYFKLVNDRFTHRVGDEVLRAVGERLAQISGPDDLVFRRGGDEFALISSGRSNRSESALRARAHEIGRSLYDARQSVCPGVDGGAGVGYVVAETDESTESLIYRGDMALHDAKLKSHAQHPSHSSDPLRADAPEVVPTETTFEQDIVRQPQAIEMVERERALDPSTGVKQFGQTVGWKTATLLFSAGPFAIAMLGLIGANNEFRSAAVFAICVVGLAASPICFYLARVGSSDTVVNFFMMSGLSLITALMAVTDQSRLELVDAYLLVVIIGSFYLPFRSASGYLVASMMLYTYWLFPSGYEFAIAKLAVAGLLAVSMFLLLTDARRKALKHAATQARRAAVDGLTGIANLRTLRTHLESVTKNFDQTECNVMLIAIDLDDFKSVNDTYSHTTGDLVLHETAAATCAQVSELDLGSVDF